MERIIAVILTSITLISCESLIQDVSPDKLPKSDNKLVINMYISPQDTLLVANVQIVAGVFDTVSFNNITRKTVVKDAKISLSDGKSTVDLVYNTNSNLYTAKATALKIVSGNTYFLKATDNINREYSAQTTVPFAVPFRIGTITSKKESNFNSSSLTIPFSWTAKPNTYYRVGVNNITTNKFTDQFGKTYFNKSEIFDFYNGLAINETSQDMVITKNKESYFVRFVGGSNNQETSTQSTVIFLTVDKNYYNYHRQVELNNTDSNPFAEPLIITSNINNGFGCFGSFIKSEQAIVIPKN